MCIWRPNVVSGLIFTSLCPNLESNKGLSLTILLLISKPLWMKVSDKRTKVVFIELLHELKPSIGLNISHVMIKCNPITEDIQSKGFCVEFLVSSLTNDDPYGKNI